jgi:hypothetical protein
MGRPHRANAIAAWFIAIIATCLLVTPAVAGDDDASHFMVCRSGECVDLPSMRIIPRLETPAPTPPAANADTPLIPGEPAPDPFAREIEADIADFCNKHPDERFCGKLALWMRQHGKTRP